MKIIECEQGSPEWINARIGLPTASNFDKIITPTGNASKSADRYLGKLAAEWFLGQCLDDFERPFMQRGTDLESSAVAAYEINNDVDTVKVGLCMLDDGSAGASPDRLVGDDGLLEIKCPSAEVHMMYVLGGPPDDYFVQIQGQLWVTGRKWCDLLCFHPTLPSVSKRYTRDEKFIERLAVEVVKLTARLAAAKDKLAGDKSEHDAANVDEELPAELS